MRMITFSAKGLWAITILMSMVALVVSMRMAALCDDLVWRLDPRGYVDVATFSLTKELRSGGPQSSAKIFFAMWLCSIAAVAAVERFRSPGTKAIPVLWIVVVYFGIQLSIAWLVVAEVLLQNLSLTDFGDHGANQLIVTGVNVFLGVGALAVLVICVSMVCRSKHPGAKRLPGNL